MEEELIKIWQSSPNQERVKFEKARLMIEVKSSMDQLHRKIKYRDMTEKIGAGLVIPVLIFYTYRIPYTLSKIASVLLIGWGIYVLVRLSKAKKHKPSEFSVTYMEYLYKTRDYLNIQKELIDNILYWYILPCTAFVFLFLAGFIGVPGKLPYIIKTGIFGVVAGTGIYFLNKQAVKKQYIPRLTKIYELIALMEKNNV